MKIWKLFSETATKPEEGWKKWTLVKTEALDSAVVCLLKFILVNCSARFRQRARWSYFSSIHHNTVLQLCYLRRLTMVMNREVGNLLMMCQQNNTKKVKKISILVILHQQYKNQTEEWSSACHLEYTIMLVAPKPPCLGAESHPFKVPQNGWLEQLS